MKLRFAASAVLLLLITGADIGAVFESDIGTTLPSSIRVPVVSGVQWPTTPTFRFSASSCTTHRQAVTSLANLGSDGTAATVPTGSTSPQCLQSAGGWVLDFNDTAGDLDALEVRFASAMSQPMTICAIYEMHRDNGDALSAVMDGIDAATANRHIIARRTSSSDSVVVYNGAYLSSGVEHQYTQQETLCFLSDGASSKFTLNGTEYASAGSTSNLTGITIGAFNGGTQYNAPMRLVELVGFDSDVYTDAVAEAERFYGVGPSEIPNNYDDAVHAILRTSAVAYDFSDVDGNGTLNGGYSNGDGLIAAGVRNLAYGTGGALTQHAASSPAIVSSENPRLEFAGAYSQAAGQETTKLSGHAQETTAFVQNTGVFDIVVVYRSDRKRARGSFTHQTLFGTQDISTSGKGFLVLQLGDADTPSLYTGKGSGGWGLSNSQVSGNVLHQWQVAEWYGDGSNVYASGDMSTFGSATSITTATGSSTEDFYVGDSPDTNAYNFDGAIGFILVRDAALTAGERSTLKTFLESRFDLDNSEPVTKKVALIGDSLSASGFDDAGIPWATQIQARNPRWSVASFARNGDTASLCNGAYTDGIDGEGYDVLGIFCGINDVRTGGTGAATFATLDTAAADAQTDGLDVVWIEPTPWKNDIYVTWDTTKQAEHDALLASMNGDSGTTTVNLFDLLEDPSNANELAPAYDSGDGVHFTAAADLLVSTTVEADIP